MRRRIADALTRVTASLDRIWQSSGWFGYRGTRFWHPGIHVDQPACCKVIDFVYQRCYADHAIDEQTVAQTLGRVLVKFRHARFEYESGTYAWHSRWYHGIMDYGVAEVAYGEQWTERLALSLFNLVIGRAAPDVDLDRRMGAASSSTERERPRASDDLRTAQAPEVEIPG